MKTAPSGRQSISTCIFNLNHLKTTLRNNRKTRLFRETLPV